MKDSTAPDRASPSVNSANKAKLNRRWLPFSLSSLLGIVLVASIFFARYGQQYRAYLREKDRMVPTDFDVSTGRNILWSVGVGSVSYSGPVVSRGKVFVGTNNAAGYLDRNPSNVDLGVLLCFSSGDGEFLWQASSEKLPTGRVHDWPLQGVTSTPYVEGDRLWYVTNRCEVVCLDTEGFHDNEDDGTRDGFGS